jgi:propionate CoA-transferase
MEREALTLEVLAIAMAVHNSGGLVIVQVERIAERGSLNPREVKIPGVLVDCVVVADPVHHAQTFEVQYDPAFSSEIRTPMQSIRPMEMSERKIIARRAAMELKANSVVNLGIGMPEGVAQVANEENIVDLMTLTAEPGVIGGVPAGGLNFGAASNAQAVIDQPYQFDFYDGGGLDVAFLGLAQADREGNLNVSKFGPRLAGAGGFINISQNARKVVFVGTFTAGGLDVAIEEGRLHILREGRTQKFIETVEHRTFSGPNAVQRRQPVLYVTERCVFELTQAGLELTEIAPGIDFERDILPHMAFRPLVPRAPALMDQRVFADKPMGLRTDILQMPLERRFTYDAARDIFFINFEGHTVRDQRDIERIARIVEEMLSPLGHRVYVVVNYERFTIDADVLADYSAMVSSLVERFYLGITRYTTSAFLRAKLGDALSQRAVAPHIYESADEALAQLHELRSGSARTPHAA